MTIDEAREYVGTTPLSGLAQVALLERIGVRRSALLEIGCGALHFAKAFLAMHSPGSRYCGMDPNVWLRDEAIDHDPMLGKLLSESEARFSTAEDFDGRAAFRHKFDVVFSHSVLTHVGHAQLVQFMAGAARSLWPGGTLVASVTIAREEPTMTDEWTYPSGVTVDGHELRAALTEHGFDYPLRPDLRDLYMSWCPVETHDWIVATYRGPSDDR